MTTTTIPDADRRDPVKAKHRAMWASGDYPSMAAELVAPLGRALVAATAVAAGERVLDVAAGTGNAAVAAASQGAHAVASDLTPELLDAGRRRHPGVALWVRADAEDLPFLDADFDVVLSCIGAMFAPVHERTAAEVLRVCRPGGRVGLLAWAPDGFIGEMLALTRPHAAPPPPGASSPLLWGVPAHVASLLGDGVTDLTTTRARLAVDRFAHEPPDGLRTYFKERYGPTIAVYRNLADRPGDAEALDAALDDLAARHRNPDGSMEWDYVIVTATRAAA